MFENIFESSKEIDRLAVQNRLLKEYEEPVCRRLLEGRQGVRVLDVGCNNGSKTAARFSRSGVSTVIGLEYNQTLADRAQAAYGDDRFSFYRCDVEQPEFPDQLRGWMAERRVEAFDLIHISLVLLHLRGPGQVLRQLKQFLTPDGRLLIIEANDAENCLSSRDEHLFREFMDILRKDPFSGNRELIHNVPKLLADQGYTDIVLENAVMGAKGHEKVKKEEMFDTFFSYLPEDVTLLREQEPENPLYLQWEEWVSQHYETLYHQIISEGTEITLGLSIYTARKEISFTVQRLTEEYLDRAVALCAQCVGENLYPKSYIASILHQTDHYYNLLLSPEGDIAGYIYFHLCSLEEAAAEAKLPVQTLSVIAPMEHPVVAKFQSIGVEAGYRHLGLSRRLVELALEQAQESQANAAMCIAWKVGEAVPMGDNVLACGFHYLTDAHLVWYDNENLVCPYCKGRCKCDAAIYYKALEGRDSLET